MATKTIKQLDLELKEARRKYKEGELLSHNECLTLLLRQEITQREFCELDAVISEQWHRFLQAWGRSGTELDGEDFFLLIHDFVDDPTDADKFWKTGGIERLIQACNL